MSLKVRRYDARPMGVGNRQTLPSGQIRLTGELTRSGVFEYTRPSGEVVREYRPADEVSKADALATIDDLPVTVGHPRAGVSAASLDAIAAGHVRSPVAAEDNGATVVRGTITTTKSDARSGVLSGKLAETSMGYDCRLDETPGIAPNGQRYDAIQRDIVYNHVALLPPGGARLGTRLDGVENDRVLRLDAAGNQISTERTIVKIKVKKSDGKEVEFEQYSPEHFSHVEAERDAAAARADALELEVKSFREDAAKAARAELEQVASTVCGKDFKADGKSDRDVKAAVIAARLPTIKLDGKDDAYVSTMFDAALASAPVAAAKPRKDQSQAELARGLRSDELPAFMKKKSEKGEDEEEDETEKKAKEAAKKADSAWERN